MNMKLKTLIALSLTATLSSKAMADIQWNGFASIVGSRTTSSDDRYLGYDDDINFDKGSLFALQASSSLGDGLTVTAQVLARGDEDWDPEFEWAYVNYDVNDQFSIVAGRQRAPFYMYSQYLDVSYAYPWISPPNGVYDLIFSRIDGLSAIYNMQFDETEISTQVIYGNHDNDVDILDVSTSVEFNNLAGIAVTLTHDWLTLRGGYFASNDASVRVTGLDPLVNGWSQAGFDSIANDLELEGDDSIFAEFGFQVDYNDFLILGEYTYLETKDSFATEETSYYVTFGKRFDEFLVHITYGDDENDPQHLTDDVPYGIDPALDFLKANTDGFTQSIAAEGNYVTLGLRWDFHDSAAFKFEYTDYSDDLDSNDDAGLVRAALVTVF